MESHLNLLFSVWMKFFFLLTPFFVLSMFLSMTQGWTVGKRIGMSIRIGVAALVACVLLFFFGNTIFKLFGITLDAFRIGAGAMLFLSAVALVSGGNSGAKAAQDSEDSDIAVVPLAIPITVGPGTTGALLVMGAETSGLQAKFVGCLSLLFAVGSLLVILFMASPMEKVFGRRGISILSKLTGLFIAAIAAQMMFTGIKSFLS